MSNIRKAEKLRSCLTQAKMRCSLQMRRVDYEGMQAKPSRSKNMRSQIVDQYCHIRPMVLKYPKSVKDSQEMYQIHIGSDESTENDVLEKS